MFAVDPGEGWRALLVTAYLFLVIASYVMLKAVRDGLYLDAFGAVKLPYVIIGIAVLVGLFVDIYIRISRHVRVPMLIALTLGGCIACLLTFWSLGRSGRTWLYPVLYIWVGCFGVIAPVQVWTLINEVFATRQVSVSSASSEPGGSWAARSAARSSVRSRPGSERSTSCSSSSSCSSCAPPW